jgi:hypothetical protein
MSAEILIDLEALEGFIEATSSGALAEHKSIHHLLKSLLHMGARWRDPPQIILTKDGTAADFHEEMQHQLDLMTGLKIE